jgi:pyrophosphate--fructose-6-phosphate 1-phosphotransferase
VAPANEWIAGGIPLTMMMNLEQRHGSKKPVIKKALVDLNGRPYKTLEEKRATWAEKTCFIVPGAIQYFGPSHVCDAPTITLKLEHEK